MDKVNGEQIEVEIKRLKEKLAYEWSKLQFSIVFLLRLRIEVCPALIS